MIYEPDSIVEDVISEWRARQDADGPILARMREIRDLANGDVIVPLNEMDRNAKSSVANLLMIALEQMSARVGSTMPSPYFPPLYPSRAGQKAASTRREALRSMWDQNSMNMKLRRRARHLLGYSRSPAIVLPDFREGRVRWHIRNPLESFPAPRDDEDDPVPEDMIFAHLQTYRWLKRRYPEAAKQVWHRKIREADRFRILTVTDPELIASVLVCPDEREGYGLYGEKAKGGILLDLAANPVGMPVATCPNRITLDLPRGQFDGLVGMHYTRARLDALTLVAIERGIFPESYLVARPGEVPEIITPADGPAGVLGVVRGGDIKTDQINPGYMTHPMLDRLERQERLEGGVPADFTGEAATNVRTARRGDSILSSTVDFRVQEAQETFQIALKAEDRIAIEMERVVWGQVPRSFFVSGRAGDAKRDYVPGELWAKGGDYHHVRYSAAGSDVNNLVIGIGQRIGTGLMSKQSGREADPMIEDPEGEEQRIVAEGIEAALLSSIQQQAAMPDGPYQPDDLAFIVSRVRAGSTLADAVTAAQRRAQERQAAEVEPEDPEAQPGLALPGMGAEAGTVPEVEPGVAHLSQLLGALNRPRQVAASMGG